MVTKNADPPAAKAADAAGQDLQEQLRSLRADVAELTTTLGRFSRAQAESLRDQAQEGLRAARTEAEEQLAAAGDFAGRKYVETEDYIRANPATAIGIAAGVGFLVGLVMSRR